MTTFYAAKKIPVIGNTIYHAGRLYDLWTTPCNTGWRITVEGFFAYAPTLIWGLYGPGMIETVKQRFGRGHSRRAKGKFIAKEWDQKIPVPKAAIYQISWTVTNIIERIGWFLIIADATTDFLLNWTSMVYAVEGCDVPGAAYANINLDSPPYAWPWQTSWQVYHPFDHASSHIFSAGYNGGGIEIPQNYSFSTSFNTTVPTATDPTAIEFAISDGVPGTGQVNIPIKYDPTDPTPNSYNASQIFWASTLPSMVINIWTKATALVEYPVAEANFSATGAYSYGLKPVTDWKQYFKK